MGREHRFSTSHDVSFCSVLFMGQPGLCERTSGTAGAAISLLDRREMLELRLERRVAHSSWYKIITHHMDDHGGGLARVDGCLCLVRGLALPSERVESELSFYNFNTFWIDIDQLLSAFSLTRADRGDEEKLPAPFAISPPDAHPHHLE